MASPTQWTWVWVNSGSWWWTGRPGVLQFMGSQRVGYNWETELNWTPWKESYDQPRQHIKKQRHYFVNKGPSSQGYGFSNSHVWMWELDYKESWTPKNWCFWTVLEKTLESPLDCKEIQPVHPKGDQSWVFIGGTDVEAETPILWPTDANSWLILKDPDAGKDWGQEENGTTEDETVGWHHRLNGHRFRWTPGVDDRQGGLACCSSWGCKESDTTEWTELNWRRWPKKTKGDKRSLEKDRCLRKPNSWVLCFLKRASMNFMLWVRHRLSQISFTQWHFSNTWNCPSLIHQSGQCCPEPQSLILADCHIRKIYLVMSFTQMEYSGVSGREMGCGEPWQ